MTWWPRIMFRWAWPIMMRWAWWPSWWGGAGYVKRRIWGQGANWGYGDDAGWAWWRASAYGGDIGLKTWW